MPAYKPQPLSEEGRQRLEEPFDGTAVDALDAQEWVRIANAALTAYIGDN